MIGPSKKYNFLIKTMDSTKVSILEEIGGMVESHKFLMIFLQMLRI
jgi:hypothetical protein